MPLCEIFVVNTAIESVIFVLLVVFVFAAVHLSDNQIISGHKHSGICIILATVINISDHPIFSVRHVDVYGPFVVFHVL